MCYYSSYKADEYDIPYSCWTAEQKAEYQDSILRKEPLVTATAEDCTKVPYLFALHRSYCKLVAVTTLYSRCHLDDTSKGVYYYNMWCKEYKKYNAMGGRLTWTDFVFAADVSSSSGSI